MKSCLLIALLTLTAQANAQVSPWAQLVSVQCDNQQGSTLSVDLDSEALNRYSVVFSSCTSSATSANCSSFGYSGSQKLTVNAVDPNKYKFEIINGLPQYGQERTIMELLPNSKGLHDASVLDGAGQKYYFKDCAVLLKESSL